MTFGRLIGTLSNVALTIAGAWAAKAFLLDNGLIKLGESIYASSRATLTGSNIPLQKEFSGYLPLDRFLALFSLFFYPAMDGKNPGLSLLGSHFVGQMIPIYLVILTESFRVGNSWRLISFSAVWFFLVENVGSMIFTPLWCLLHLVTSPTLSPNAPLTVRRTSLLVHPVELWAIPWSVLIASGIPITLASVLPMTPQSPRWSSAQFWVSARQFHPFFTSIAHLLVSMLSQIGSNTFDSPAQRNRKVASSLRHVYRVATFIAIFTHVQTMTLTVTAQFLPGMLSSPYKNAFLPEAVWKPFPFWEGVPKATSFVAEAVKFLQWDEIISVAAFLSWAFALNRDGVATVGKGSGWIGSILRTVVLTVIGGPATAGIDLLRERDELFLEDEEASEEKKTN